MLLTPCVGVPGEACGAPAPPGGCPRHRRARERAHHNRAYDGAAWRRVRARTMAAHRAKFGDWCPGAAGHGAHSSDDLTVDHIVPLAAGGSVLGPVRVLCRAHNGRLGAAQGPPGPIGQQCPRGIVGDDRRLAVEQDPHEPDERAPA